MAFNRTILELKQNKSGNVMTLQIEMNGEKHVVFTGSDYLINQINQIEKNGEHFEFK